MITADAKHTTRELTAKIVGLGGHYLLTVKGNAPAAYAALDELLLRRGRECPGHPRERARLSRDPGNPAGDTA